MQRDQVVERAECCEIAADGGGVAACERARERMRGRARVEQIRERALCEREERASCVLAGDAAVREQFCSEREERGAGRLVAVGGEPARELCGGLGDLSVGRGDE